MTQKRFLLLLFFTFLLFVYSACSIASAENLLINGDFYELDEDGLPAGWYTDAYIQEQGYTVFSVKNVDSEHPHAAFIQNVAENDARFAQLVEVDPESNYLFSGYIRTDDAAGGHGANLSVEGIYAFSEKCYDTKGQWHYIEYYGETGPNQEYITVFARLGGYSGESTGSAAFADLSLVKVSNVPDDIVPDLWYTDNPDTGNNDDKDQNNETETTPAWPWLLLISSAYTMFALFAVNRIQKNRQLIQENTKNNKIITATVLAAALIVRFGIAWFVEGYMVDVNCFTSWGHTMASYGPAQFYQATNFCDYPPLYTYVLGLNSIVSGLFGNSQTISRIVFRFVPSICDLLGCWLILCLIRQNCDLSSKARLVFLAFLAFNPATILNSAAWGQMDSVLCLLLLITAISAVREKWLIALPVYVVSVLVKPQALMLGPLGLAYLVITLVRTPNQLRTVLKAITVSLFVLAAGVIPFTLQQNWDWIIQLYSRTLASYPYATVNTANFYYLLGGNWASVTKSAHILAPLLAGLFCLLYGFWWHHKAKQLHLHLIETGTGILFSIGFLLCAVLNASWAWVGGISMAFAFVIVLSPAVRTGNLRFLPYLGAVLYILLYVFGVKMHERYLFPAILLLAASWVYLKDRRILYLLILFSFTLFMNEGIVLDNSIRLGSSYGHLNKDTVLLADLISLLNCAGAFYAVWLAIELFIPGMPDSVRYTDETAFRKIKYDRKLYWSHKDTILLSVITVLYSVVSLLTLGSTKAPQTTWVSSSAEEQVIFDLGEYHEDFRILYFAQVSRNDFYLASSDDGILWKEDVPAQMDQGQCWKWKYVTESYDNGSSRTYLNNDESNIIRFSGRYIRLSPCQLGLKLNELLFRDENGTVLPVTVLSRNGAAPESELFSDPENLVDEQDTLEKLPSIPESDETRNAAAQPSWWNSTYFDEIYHARTAYEFLRGTVPYETSHPPFGKVLMSIAVAVFGMTPFGWRFAGALAGILMLPGMYLIGKQLTKKTPAAVIACLLMALDCMHLTQTQIATIDSFPVLFIIFAYFFMLRFLQMDFLREKIRTSLISLGASGFFMGLAIASKWIGIYAGAGLAVLFFWHSYRVIRNREGEAESKAPVRDSLRRFLTICLWCILFFVIIPLMIYLLSYIPYLAYNAKKIHSIGDYISEVWRSQTGMFNYHSTKNLGMDHPFYSPWWEWPIIGKPMYYASQQFIPADFPVHHSIFCFGNPVIWYGGLAALLVCLYRFVSERRFRTEGSELLWHLRPSVLDIRYVFIFIGLLAQYLPWVLVPRGTYIYHYFASLPFLMLAITLCFIDTGSGSRRISEYMGYGFIFIAAVFFILLFPYASGISVSGKWLNIGKSMLRIWY